MSIQRLKELEAKATPRPWGWSKAYGTGFIYGPEGKAAGNIACALDYNEKQDSQLVVEMRNQIHKLIAFVDAYDHWLELFQLDASEDLPDDGSLEASVKRLDATRKALEKP